MDLLHFLNLKTKWLLLYTLLSLIPIGILQAKVKVVTPAPKIAMVKSSPYGGGGSHSSKPSSSKSNKKENPNSAIYANGHNVVISDAGRSPWGSPWTKVWVDENDNGREDADETLTDYLNDVFIYGGSEDSNVMKSYNITMTGGNIKGIIGGGYAANSSATVKGNINIVVSGGSISYVDGGGDQYDTNNSCTVTGNVDILLYNCKYDGYYYINNNDRSNVNGFFRVRDFSTHIRGCCEWGNVNAGFFGYMIQTGPGQMAINWRGSGYGVIPASVNMSLNSIHIDYYTYVENKGHIHMNSCWGDIVDKGNAWIGNALEMPHEPSSDVRDRNANTHSVSCLNCGKTVKASHTFRVIESTASSSTGAKHKKVCTVCSYTVEETCIVRYSKQNDEQHIAKCIGCGHTFYTDKHRAEAGSFKNFSQENHTAFCIYCNATYKTAHTWSKAETSSCSGCGATGHTHDYQNGICTICKFAHIDHTAGATCSICGKGCEHKNITFQNNQDPSGHYYECSNCNQVFKKGDHQMIEDATRGYVCQNNECSFACNHAETLNQSANTTVRSYSTPNGTISYDVEHNEHSCTRCGKNIDCKITDSEGNVYYMTTLDAAMQYAIQHKMDNATITLLKNIDIRQRIFLNMKDITLTLDVNDCDIRYSGARASSIVVSTGSLKIVNSAFEETGHYANLYNATSAVTIDTYPAASLYMNGVHVSLLTVGTLNITLGDVEIEGLSMNGVTDPVKINDKVTVYSYIALGNYQISKLLPTGYIIAEYVDESTWERRYDHTSTTNKTVGNMAGTNLLRIMRCDDHKVETGISWTESGHSGTCVYCAGQATNIAHSMTQSGHQKDDQHHYKKCEFCNYEDGEEAHIIDQKTGLCTADLCKTEAAVELHLEGEKGHPNYFCSFASAWENCRDAKLDTIVLRKDVEVSEPLPVRSMTYTYENGDQKVFTPYTLVMGEGMTLTYTGQGNPLSFAGSAEDAQDALSFLPGLKCSSNWAEGAVHAHPIRGAVFNEAKTEVSICNEHLSDNSVKSYKVMTDESGNNQPFHEVTCTLCNLVYDENHIYNNTEKCQCCDVERVIVATGTTGDGTEIGRYGSLNEAMAAAATYSAENTTPVTIHILQNLDVEPEDYGGAGAIILDKEGADIILDATAPNGEQYEINGHEKYVLTSDGSMQLRGWNLIGVEKGKLTILSGIYQAKETAVYLGYDCPGQIQLKGGTYLQGTYATVNNVDGACASYITRYGELESAGLRSLIATGYYMQLNRPNHEKNQPNMMDEEIVSHLTPISVVSGSGTVYKCNHENLGEVVPAREMTCTVSGYPSYQVCKQCGAAFYEENGETIMSTVEEITIPARGHDYVTDDEEGEDAVYYCRYCDQPARAVTASCKVVNRQTGETIEAEGLDCNEVGFKDFFDAWNVRGSYVEGANTFTNGKIDKYDESIKIITTYTLHTDLDYTGVEGKHLINMCLWHDYIIDLNGHNLNLGDYMLRTNEWTYYPGKDALTIRDSQKAGKTITAKINTNGGMAYDPEEPSFMSKKDLILEDVTLKTSFLYDAKDLLLNEGAGIIFLENCREYLGVLTMTTGSFLEGYGISHISFKTGAPQSANLAKALHNAKYYTIHDDNMEEVSGIGSSTFNGSYLNLYMPDGEPVSSDDAWRITVPEGDVTHEFKDRLADKDRYHSGLCTHCGMNVQGEHIYANHACVLCLHRPEAYAVVEGITSDHTTLASAIEAVQGHVGTIVLTQDLRSNITLKDNTELTLDLNGHKITSQGACGIYVDGAKLTIIDSSENTGEIENTDFMGSCIIVSSKSNNSLTIMDGNYTAKDGAVIINAAQINTDGYPSVSIYGGSYTSIRTGSMESDVMEMLGTDCYFRSTEDDHLVNVSTNGQGYQYVENVYAYNSDMKLKQNQTVQIDNQTSASAEDCNTIIAEAVRNINVNSFGQTNISQTVDLSNILLISDLQRAVSAAGIEKMLTLSENIQAYVEAKLMATTIESVQVIGSAKDTRVEAMTRMTFDVNPYAYMNIDGTIVATPIDPEMVTEDVTFRLPVDSRYEVAFLQVYYTDEEGINTYLGNYPVLNSLTAGDNISKYIEIESNKFGTYEYSVVNTYTLADAETFVNPGTTVMENVSYTRTFATAGEWEALYIPLSISPAAEYDIADIFTFGNMVDTNGDGQINEEDEVVLIIDKLEADDVTEPNAPYLIRATETGEVTIASVDNILYGAEPFNGSCSTTRTKYTFQGSYREMEFYGTNENFSLQEGTIKTEQDILAPQRWFIQMSSLTPSFNPEITQAQSAGIRVFSIGEELDRETAIRLLQGETIDVWKNGKRYTLDGRRAVGSTRGIQIINNKKVIEK